MALPFTTLKPVEEVIIGGIPMAKRGCLTMSELQAVAELGATQEDLLRGKNALQTDLILKQHVITILLKSRVDRSWSLERTQAAEWDVVMDGRVQQIEPDALMLDELFTFFMGEQRQWKEPEPESEPGKKRPTGRKSTGS